MLKSARNVPIFVFPYFASVCKMMQSYLFHFWQSYGCGGKTAKKKKGERSIMKNNNQINVPQAREAMDKFKMQAAQEVGVNLTNGYNGHLTSREAGSVGGQMVKKMIEAYEQGLQ